MDPANIWALDLGLKINIWPILIHFMQPNVSQIKKLMMHISSLGKNLYPVGWAKLSFTSVVILSCLMDDLTRFQLQKIKKILKVICCWIANLACSDIVIAIFCIPFQFYAALLQRWDLPEFMCKFCPFTQNFSVNVSIFTLVAIAKDR